jgi:hypothetical protein
MKNQYVCPTFSPARITASPLLNMNTPSQQTFKNKISYKILKIHATKINHPSIQAYQYCMGGF